MGITVKQLRDATWTLVYQYDSDNGGFKTYASDDVQGITITHERKAGRRGTLIYYSFEGYRTDSPRGIVTRYSEAERRRSGGSYPPGSAEQVKERKAAGG